MFSAARRLQAQSHRVIHDALRLLNRSNPRLVHWVLYSLADIYENASEAQPHTHD